MSIPVGIVLLAIAIGAWIIINLYTTEVVDRLNAINFELKRIRLYNDPDREKRISEILRQLKLSFPDFTSEFTETHARNVHDLMISAVKEHYINIHRPSLLGKHSPLDKVWTDILRKYFDHAVYVPQDFVAYVRSTSDEDLPARLGPIRAIVDF